MPFTLGVEYGAHIEYGVELMGAIFPNYSIDVILNGILMIEFMMINFLSENIQEKVVKVL